MGVGTAPLAGISDEGDPFMETKVIWELDIAKLGVGWSYRSDWRARSNRSYRSYQNYRSHRRRRLAVLQRTHRLCVPTKGYSALISKV